MFEDISALVVAKWASLVFLAGFIGFFGKALARVILSLFQKKKAEDHPLAEPPSSVSSSVETRDLQAAKTISMDEHKALKKALKAQSKFIKKANKD